MALNEPLYRLGLLLRVEQMEICLLYTSVTPLDIAGPKESLRNRIATRHNVTLHNGYYAKYTRNLLIIIDLVSLS